MITYTPPKPAEHIPIVDLAPSFADDPEGKRAVAWEIHKACRDTGFFYVKNHGVPEALCREQLAWTERFFARPADDKLKLDFKASPRRLGYEPFLRQVLDEGSAPDLKESYMYRQPFRDGRAEDPTNQWPADLPGFREQMTAYRRAIGTLALHLVHCVAQSLDLPDSYFDDGFDPASCSVRILHYPPQADIGRQNQLGAGAHTDWGALTVLLQDSAGGLEVRNASGQWIRAEPIEGTFVINLGDMMRRWTNDVYHSTLHRVLNNVSGRDRYSVATFCGPHESYLVECVPTCRPTDRAPLYAPCTAGEHTRQMAAKTYDLAAAGA
jgi:isopenicillin N synthase-like dioxygenase